MQAAESELKARLSRSPTHFLVETLL